MILRGLGGLVRKPGRAVLLSARTDARGGPGHPQPGAGGGGQPGPRRAARPARRRAERRPRPATTRRRGRRVRCPTLIAAAHPVQRPDHARTAASRSGRCRCQTIKDIKSSAGRHGQRRGDGGVRRRAAHLAGGPRRAARRPARRHDPGVGPHRRGGRAVDEPRLGDLRLAPRRRARPARAGPAGARGHGRRQGALRRRAGRDRSPTSPSSRRRRSSRWRCAPPPGSPAATACRSTS